MLDSQRSQTSMMLSMTQPYSFLSLVFASLIGYYVFSETPDLFTWIGASVIFIGVFIMSYREMKA